LGFLYGICPNLECESDMELSINLNSLQESRKGWDTSLWSIHTLINCRMQFTDEATYLTNESDAQRRGGLLHAKFHPHRRKTLN